MSTCVAILNRERAFGSSVGRFRKKGIGAYPCARSHLNYWGHMHRRSWREARDQYLILLTATVFRNCPSSKSGTREDSETLRKRDRGIRWRCAREFSVWPWWPVFCVSALFWESTSKESSIPKRWCVHLPVCTAFVWDLLVIAFFSCHGIQSGDA